MKTCSDRHDTRDARMKCLSNARGRGGGKQEDEEEGVGSETAVN